MKLLFTLFMAFMLTVSTISFAQTTRSTRIVNKVVEVPEFKNTLETQATTVTVAPTIYTNETQFKAAIQNDYFLDEFNDCVKENQVSSLIRTTGNYTYTITEPNGVYELDGAISVPKCYDSIIVTNTGQSVYAFGGYFYNSASSGSFLSGDLKLRVGSYSYTFTASSTTAFIGFIFSQAVTSFSIKYPTVQTTATYYPSLDHLYWGNVATTTSIKNIETTGVSVFPSPTSDIINLSSAEGIKSVNITNLSGKIVWSGSASEFPLSVSSFAKGLYLVNLISNDGIKTEKIIIK
jgi:hypothetical protein